MAPSNKTPLVGYGLTQREPKLNDVLRAWRAEILINLFAHMPGKIVSYSYPTATIQILGQRVLKNGTTSPYPQLQNVPVITLQGGGSALQFPITPGDQCLVLFSDRNIDAWFQNGGSQPPFDGRLHDISDGFAIVGINWKGSKLIPAPSATETRLILSDGTTKIGLNNGKITVANSTGTLLSGLSNLVTVLQNLCTALEGITITDPQGGTGSMSPASVAAIQLINTSLTTVSSELSALLY